jgi:phosphoglycerate dehydrogenase-like enzyme
MNKPKIVTFGPNWSEEIVESLFEGKIPSATFLHGGNRGEKTERETCEAVRDATVILVNPGSPDITRSVIEAAEKVRLIQSMVVGYDNVDVQAASEMVIPVANNPGWNAISVAEHTTMLILMTLKKALYMIRINEEQGWAMRDLVRNFDSFGEFRDRTIGIIGLGAIGKEVSKLANAFGAKVIYYKRNRLPVEEEEELHVDYASFNDLLSKSDIVSIHVPLYDETLGLIGEDEISLMKEGAILINTSRPGVIDEHAVAKALQEGRLSGAGLDGVNTRVVDGAFFNDSPLSKCDNVVITPHIAGPTREAKARGVKQWVKNVCRFLNGENPLYLVNDVWSKTL